ncbi:hypothetical protein DPMN_007000 [Dreissena polymorpha]|uniref:Uncharacterized protein n=1 Tax=Dreissena polymorpha TaxID=45954 RepID=A0A9D4RYB0_DREPO|nr:hypothetical protein DPMN_007000 [Dreissena polymorpha]
MSPPVKKIFFDINRYIPMSMLTVFAFGNFERVHQKFCTRNIIINPRFSEGKYVEIVQFSIKDIQLGK